MLLDQPKVIPEAVRRIRMRKLHITQQQLAERSGLSLGQVNRIESGKIESPHFSTLSKIAEALGVETEEIMRWND